MFDSPLWLISVGMLVGSAVAGFLARRSRLRLEFPVSFEATADTDLLTMYRALLHSVVQDERRLLILARAELVRRGLPVPQ